MKVSLIKTMVLAVDLLPEERLKLVYELISEWKLTSEDILAKPEIFAQPEKRKRGRPKKVKPVAEDILPVQKEEAPKKRRGRPRKVKPEDKGAELLATVAMAENSASDSLAETRAQQLKIYGFEKFADDPSLKQYVMGNEQPFQIMYKRKNHLLLSPYVLTDFSPIGIYIPYKNKFVGKYTGFILDIYDEKVLTDSRKAVGYLQKNRKRVGDEQWWILNHLQWSVLREHQGVINALLRSLGGDIVGKNYKLVAPYSGISSGAGQIRYSVNIQL